MVCQKGEKMKKSVKIITVNEKWRILREDECNFTLQERCKSCKKEVIKNVWQNRGFFGDVKSCLKKVISLTDPDVNMEIEDYVERIEKVYQSIENVQV